MLINYLKPLSSVAEQFLLSENFVSLHREPSAGSLARGPAIGALLSC